VKRSIKNPEKRLPAGAQSAPQLRRIWTCRRSIASLPPHANDWTSRRPTDVTSKRVKSRPLALARALICKHASAAGAGAILEVALKLHLNPRSQSVTIARFRKAVPDLFNMPLHEFLDARGPPSASLQTLMGPGWAPSTEKLADDTKAPSASPEPNAEESDRGRPQG
jgi:hypothetical protein